MVLTLHKFVTYLQDLHTYSPGTHTGQTGKVDIGTSRPIVVASALWIS